MSNETPVSIPPITIGYDEYADELKDVPLILTPPREIVSSKDYAIYMRSLQIPMKFTPCLRKYSWDPYMRVITESDVDRAKRWYKRTIEPAYKLPQQLMTLIEMRRKQQLSRKARRRRENRKSWRDIRSRQQKETEKQQEVEERRGRSRQRQQQQKQKQQKQKQRHQEATPLLRDQQEQQFHLPLRECQKHHDPQQYMYSPPPYYTAPPPFKLQGNDQLLMIHQRQQYQSQIRDNRHHGHAQQQLGQSQTHHIMSTPQHVKCQYNQVMFMNHQQQTHQVYYRYPWSYQ
ncbi:hypothetical protein LSM04_001244 [Trypanosoma melophagium]|uniref:uncharacterized protein n=1 Tax=Trypanosoma melophagium TaxID=715481 RepID=UPI00351AA157|nr:hypothetical protein LSM04_001244 [Trypanosoma melophagium]